MRAAAVQAKHEMFRRVVRTRLRGSEGVRDLSDVAVVTAMFTNNGIARGAVLQQAALERAGLKARLLDVSAGTRSLLPRIPHEPASAYVLHAGVPETNIILNGLLPAASRAWRVGYWAWELPVAPPEWRRYTDVVSEVWTPSRFVADSLTPLFDGPVRVVPHVVPVQPIRVRDHEAPFTVLTMADSRSSFARKNPLGAIRAFRRAFGDSPTARLVVKLNGRQGDMASLISSAGAGPNVRMITEFLDEDGLDGLYRSADVLLSLHRAEGFGLPMREAMARGVPVIGTGWSGNTEFMTEVNSRLVPYRLVPVVDPSGIYKGGCWAEPDEDAAADMLRELRDHPSLHEGLARAAHDAVTAGDALVSAWTGQLGT